MTSKSKQRSFAKDVHYLHKNIDSMSGGQARVVEFENAKLLIEIIPSDGHYKGGKWKFKIFGGDSYPSLPPLVRCETEIYHPNIDMEEDGIYDDESGFETNICVSLLEEGEWNESMSLEDCVQAILFLFYNPNWSDALSPMFSCDMTEEEFEQNVALSLKGGDVDGYTFEANYGFVETQDNKTEVELVNEMNKLNTEKTEELVLERIDSIIDTACPDTESQGQTTEGEDSKQGEVTPDSQTEANDTQEVDHTDDESVKFIVSLLDELIQERKEADVTTPQEVDGSGRTVRLNSATEVFKRSISQADQVKFQEGGTLSSENTVISPEEMNPHDENLGVWKQSDNEGISEGNEVVEITEMNKEKTAVFVFDNLIPGCEILPILNAYVCEKLFEGS